MQSRKSWTTIEDQKLLRIIKKFGIKNWSLIADKLAVATTFDRTGKQCRERWFNHLNPVICKKEWSEEQDELLFDAHHRYGSKWKQISKLFEGRTDNSIKNHFYSSVRLCLRKLSKMSGGRFGLITMKSIKPNVLSQIVQNSQLSGMILSVLRSKKQENKSQLHIDESFIAKIEKQIKIIESFDQTKKSMNLTKNSKITEITNEDFSLDHNIKIQQVQTQNSKNIAVKEQVMRNVFEENQQIGDSHQQIGLSTYQDSRQTRWNNHILFSLNQEGPQAIQENLDEGLQESLGYYFTSPAAGKLPALKMLHKISKNSNGSGCGILQEQGREQLKPQCRIRQQKIEILFNYDWTKKQDDC